MRISLVSSNRRSDLQHLLSLKDRDTEFLTRTQGERVRNEMNSLIDKMSEGDRLVIDFNGVEGMTPSFADECFGKLAKILGPARFKAVVLLTNANDSIRVLINSVLSHRLSSVKGS